MSKISCRRLVSNVGGQSTTIVTPLFVAASDGVVTRRGIVGLSCGTILTIKDRLAEAFSVTSTCELLELWSLCGIEVWNHPPF
jgi:hypothetical protein